MYLNVDTNFLLSLLQKVLPCERDLEQAHIEILLYLFEHYKDLKESLLAFYWRDLQIYSENEYLFGKEFPTENEHKWIHMPSEEYKILRPRTNVKFEAFGIKWIIMRYIHSFGYEDNADLVKIYVDNDFNSTVEPLDI